MKLTNERILFKINITNNLNIFILENLHRNNNPQQFERKHFPIHFSKQQQLQKFSLSWFSWKYRSKRFEFLGGRNRAWWWLMLKVSLSDCCRQAVRRPRRPQCPILRHRRHRLRLQHPTTRRWPEYPAWRPLPDTRLRSTSTWVERYTPPRSKLWPSKCARDPFKFVKSKNDKDRKPG